MSYVDGLVSVMEGQIDDAEDGLDRAQSLGPDIIERLTNVYLATIPLPPGVKNHIADILIGRLHDAISYARDALASQRKMVESLGSPDTLRAAASAIGDKVSSAGDNLALDVRVGSLQAMDPSNWRGEAEYKYSSAFDGQQDAVELISKHGGVLSDTLQKLANGIEQYYIELGIAITTGVGAIAGFVVAILAAVGVITIPIAVVSLIAAIVALIGAGLSIAAMILTVQQNVNDSLGELSSKPATWPTTKFAS